MRVTREQYLTLAQVAEHTGRTERAIETWVRRGQLTPALEQLGRPSLFALTDVLACEAERRPKRGHELITKAAARWREQQDLRVQSG